jgi:Fe-Mn family superoxide dismutase
MPHKLPDLPYEKSALEPHIDTRTMAVHHDKHHQAYVNNLNKALEDYPELQNKTTLHLLSDLDSLPEEMRLAVRNHGGGHANHSMFWNCMDPSGGGDPGGKLAKEIDETFGSFSDFQEAFSKAAATLFGVGWTWLCVDGESKLFIMTTPNQDNPISQGFIPLLGLDVWEHAYYLKYENRRADYIAAWWNVVNWTYVAANLTVANLELGVRDVAAWADDAWSKISSAFSKSNEE